MELLTLSLGNKSVTYCLATVDYDGYRVRCWETVRFCKDNRFTKGQYRKYTQFNYKCFYQSFFRELLNLYYVDVIVCDDFRNQYSEYYFILLSIFNELNYYVYYFNVNYVIDDYNYNINTLCIEILKNIDIKKLTKFYLTNQRTYYSYNLASTLIISYHLLLFPTYHTLITI